LMTSASGLLISQTADAAIKNTYTASATAGQTVFPVTNGYSTGLVDVYLNGTKLASSDYSDADGVNITLVTGSDAGDLLEFVKYSPALGVTNNALRQLTTFTSSEGQTVYSASYTPGLLDVYYNGSRLTPAEYTANNGTFITLATGSSAGDIIDMLVYSYQVGAFTGVGGGGVANQIAFYNTTSSISGSNSFTVNGSTLAITGSLSVYTGSAVEFTVNATGVNIGNALTDSHIISGSLRVNPNGLFISSSGNVGIGTTNPTTKFDLSGSIGNFQIASSGAEIFLTRNDNNDILATGGTTSGITIGAQSYVRFSTGTGYTERVRINSSGSVTIGTTSLTGWGANDRILKIQGSSGVSVVQAVSSDAGCAVWLYSGASSSDHPSLIYLKDLRFGSATDLGTGGYNERMRITSGGGLFVGTTAGINANINNEFRASNSNGGVAILSAYNTSTFAQSPAFSCYKGSNDTSSNNRFIQFYSNGESQPMGGIVGNGATNVQFASISDAREKENITSINGSLNKLLALNPVEFDWIKTGEHINAGFVAQEVEEVFPEYVVENMSNEGEEERKGLTGGMSSGIIAHLVKALQEANAKITALEEKLERNNIQ